MTTTTRLPRLPINGVLLLDKPVDWSSNDALIKAKRLVRAQKAGHTGTLDPFATGLLPLCFGEATKFSQDLFDADKTYETVVHLGIETDTGDIEGKVISTHSVDVTVTQIDAVLKQFVGKIEQVPPMYSALKRDGRPLYEYAREGITLEREARPVEIYALELLNYEAPYLTLRVTCSKGTYIRVLGQDIGQALGCGAHLALLRRTGVGHLTLAECVTLPQLEAEEETDRMQHVQPVDSLLSLFERVDLTDELATRFLHGQRLSLAKEALIVATGDGRVRVYRASDNKLLGTAIMKEGEVLAPERLISTAEK